MVLRSTLVAALAVAVLTALAPTALARDDTIASFDGTNIVLSFFPAAGLPAGQKAPTVLFGPGWSSGRTTDENSASDPASGVVGVGPLRAAGYNVLTWDPRGFGQSGGTVTVDSPENEGRDVQALIDYVARQPEARLDRSGDPRVGMTGASYGGGIQLVTAALDKRLDVIVPDIAWHSLRSSLYKDNTVKTGWASILYATGKARGRLDPHIDSAFTSGTTSGTLSADDEAWFVSRGPGDLVEKIRIPTLFTQGTVDTLFTLDEAIANYRILRRNGVPTKMVWFCGGHGSCLTNAGDTGLVERDVLAWLARYLKGDRGVETGPRFEWLDQRGYGYSANDYPLKTGAPLLGTGSGMLPLVNGGGSGPALDLSGSELGALGATVAAARAVNAVNVAIPPPEDARAIAGAPNVTLAYSGTATSPDTRVFAQIVDEDYGGVLGNQITPIPVVLDGLPHTVTRPLEVLSATARPGGTGFTLQIVASSTAYGPARAAGAVTFSSIRVEVPTLTIPAVAENGEPSDPTGSNAKPSRPSACTSRRIVAVNVQRKFRNRLRSGQVYVGKKWVARLRRSRSWAYVSFSGRKPGVVRVRLVLRLKGGRKVVDVRRFKICAPKKKKR